MRDYAKWAVANRPNYMPLSDRVKRQREVVAYVTGFPAVTAVDVALAFDISEARVRQILKRAGFRLEWVRK